MCQMNVIAANNDLIQSSQDTAGKLNSVIVGTRRQA